MLERIICIEGLKQYRHLVRAQEGLAIFIIIIITASLVKIIPGFGSRPGLETQLPLTSRVNLNMLLRPLSFTYKMDYYYLRCRAVLGFEGDK